MNPLNSNMDTREINTPSESVTGAAALPWTKPTLERLSLKQALAGTPGAGDGSNPGTS